MADAENRDRGGGDGEEDEDEDIDETGFKMIKDAVLFCIDVSESMLRTPSGAEGEKRADKDSPTIAALKCAYQLMQQRIISHPNDMMGVMLFGTEKSKFMGDDDPSRMESAYPHTYLVTDLDVPDAIDVKKLRSLVEDEEEASELLVPSKDPVQISTVLFCANQIFTTKAANFSSRRLFLVTDNDNPHPDDRRFPKNKDLRDSAAVRAKDLYDLGVTIELFPIAMLDHGFERTIFYDNIVYRPFPGDENAPAPLTSAAKTSTTDGGISLLQSLISKINSKAAPRRSAFNLPLEIGPGLKIGVKGYIVLKRQEPVRSCYVWTGGEKAQIAVGSTTKIAEDTARTVEKVEIRRAFKFGGETVSFTDEKLKKIKSFGDPVIRIIGFKDLNLVPIWANIKQPTFIYPSETDYIGSTRVFSALQQTMVMKQKIALVWFIARRNAEPRLAAAVPSEERVGDDGEQLSPPGLWLVTLPFADDIRKKPELKELVGAPASIVHHMRQIVRQLQLPKARYDPAKYPNPALQWFYRILQAMALEEEIPEKADDKTIPRHRQIDKRVGQHLLDWAEEVETGYALFEKEHKEHKSLPVVGTKRGAGASEGGAVKKPKIESDIPSEENMRIRFEKGTIDKLTIPVLKDWCHSKRLQISGKKSDLVDRVQGYFESK